MKDSENDFDNFTSDLLKNLISASAPERQMELIQLWDEHKPTIYYKRDDEKGFILETYPLGAVRFNQRSLSSLWILGFAAKKAFQLYYHSIVYFQVFGFQLSPEIFRLDQDSQELSKECQLLLSSIYDLIGIENSDYFQWPNEVPKPEDGRPKEYYNQIVFDLNCMALAFCFLHEIGHIKINKNYESHNPNREEMQCDFFAYDFLISKIEDYSRDSGYTLGNLKNKRGMGIALALVLILVITPPDKWPGTESHPSIIKRISVIMELLDIMDNDGCWLYLSCLLLALLEEKKIDFQSQWIENQKEFCLNLLKRLELSFTQNV